jgi:hypothetical protein
VIDLAAEIVSALRSSSGREAIAAAVAPVVAAEVTKALAEREERLQTYAEIVGLRPDSGRKVIARAKKTDPELVALGTYIGRTWKARRSVVLAHLARGQK